MSFVNEHSIPKEVRLRQQYIDKEAQLMKTFDNQDKYIIVVQQNGDASPRDNQSRPDKRMSNQLQKPKQIHYKSMSLRGMKPLQVKKETPLYRHKNDD